MAIDDFTPKTSCSVSNFFLNEKLQSLALGTDETGIAT